MYTLTSREFEGKSPQIHEEAFVAPQVFLSGDVRILEKYGFHIGLYLLEIE